MYTVVGRVLLGCALMSGVILSSHTGAFAVDGYIDFLPAWTHVASACAVDEDSLSKTSTAGAYFTFKGASVSAPGGPLLGPIPLFARCNVVNPLDARGLEPGNPNWNALIVTYLDPDGTGTAHRVQARLVRVSRATGAGATIATFNSNSLNITTQTERLKLFNHQFDFGDYYYYVELALTRTDASTGNPRLAAVRLAQASSVPE